MRKYIALLAMAFFIVSAACSLIAVYYMGKDPVKAQERMLTSIYLVLAAIACIQFWDKWHKT